MIRTGHLDKAEYLIKNELSVSNLSIRRIVELGIFEGEILFKKGQYPNVVKKMEHTLQLNRQIQQIDLEFKCHFMITYSCLRTGDNEKVAKHLKYMEDGLETIQQDHPDLLKTFETDIIFIRAHRARNLSQFDEAINKYRECIKLREEISDYYRTAEPHNHLGIIYDHLEDYHNAINEYQDAIETYREFDDEISLLGVMSNLGLIHKQKGNLDEAWKIFSSALKKAKANPNFERMGPMLINIGLVSIDLGRLNDAMEYFEDALKNFEEVSHKRGIILSLMNLGIIHDLLWDFDTALNYYYKAVELAEQIGNNDELCKLFINIGITLKNQNKFEMAIQSFDSAKELNIELQNSIIQGNVLYLLGTSYLQLDQLNEVEIIQIQLEDLSKKSNNIVIDRTKRLLDATILKFKSGLTNRAKAMEIFSAIIREESISYEIAISAIVNLCEILVTEVQITKNEGDLNEIEYLIEKMGQLSVESPSSIVRINILLLKSRIAFMFEKVDEAIELMEEAELIANNKQIKYLIDRVQNERNDLETKALSMQEVGVKASAKLDLISKRNIDYIDFLKKNFKKYLTPG